MFILSQCVAPTMIQMLGLNGLLAYYEPSEGPGLCQAIASLPFVVNQW